MHEGGEDKCRKFSRKNSKRRGHLIELGVDGRTRLKRISQKSDVKV
jgi:hypothetical protein